MPLSASAAAHRATPRSAPPNRPPPRADRACGGQAAPVWRPPQRRRSA